MIGENRQLVMNEPVEFEKQPVEADVCRKYVQFNTWKTGGCKHVTGWTCKH